MLRNANPAQGFVKSAKQRHISSNLTGLEKMKNLLFLKPISPPRRLFEVDSAKLQVILRAHDERDEFAGFLAPETNKALLPLQHRIQESIEELGGPCVISLCGETTADVFECLASFEELTRQDAAALLEDEKNLPMPDASPSIHEANRQRRSRARVLQQICCVREGSEAIDQLTKSPAIHAAIARTLDGEEGGSNVLELRAMDEGLPELELIAAVSTEGILTALGQRHGDVYSFCLHQHAEAIEAAAREAIGKLGALECPVVVTLGMEPTESGGFHAYGLSAKRMEALDPGDESLLQWDTDADLMSGKLPFEFRYNTNPGDLAPKEGLSIHGSALSSARLADEAAVMGIAGDSSGDSDGDCSGL